MVKRMMNAALNLVLSGTDQQALTASLARLKEVISYLLQTIPAITTLQVKNKIENVAEDVSALMDMLTTSTKTKEQIDQRASKLQELTLDASEIQLNDVIGEGGFAVVHNGLFHNKQCAVKVIKRKNGSKLSQAEKVAVENELLLTRFLADPNILHCYGFVHQVDRTLVVLELAPYGSLWEILYDDANFPSAFPFSLSVGWVKDLASALSHMYRKNVKHKDIKAENMLVYSYPDRLIAKVSSFVFSYSI